MPGNRRDYSDAMGMGPARRGERAEAAPGTAAGHARRSRLVRYLTIVYLLLIAYASLYPFEVRRGPPDNPFAFLLAEWPGYYTASDITLNVAAYGPLGFLLVLAFQPYVRARAAGVLATAVSVLLSIAMEGLQHYLAWRVASNLDVLTNGLGAMIGSLLAVVAGDRWLLSGNLYRMRQRIFLPGATTDVGFVVLAVWLFTQLSPEVWLFGSGGLRGLLDWSGALDFTPDSYRWLETGVTALNLAGVCLLVSALARDGARIEGVLLALAALALVLKSVGALTLFSPGDLTLWLTPGAILGLPAGVLLYLLLAGRPRRLVAAAAAVLLALGCVLINIAPDNPYLATSIRIWRHGHFLSFSGLTQVAGALWPLAACSYLAWLMSLKPVSTGGRRPRE
jgi:VanZ family protein